MAILLLDGWTIQESASNVIEFARGDERIVYDKWREGPHRITYDFPPEMERLSYKEIYHLAKFLGYGELC